MRAREIFAAVKSSRARRASSRLAVVSATLVASGGITAQAAANTDCSAVNQGVLNVELGSTASDTRQVTLRAGDTLTFAFRAPAGPFGTLTLLQGAGPPRLLLVGPTGTSVTFVAASRGSFGFQFAKEGEETAAFTATCVPARSAHRGTQPMSSSVSRRVAKPLAESVGALQVEEPGTVALDPGAPEPEQDGRAPALAPSTIGRDAIALGVSKPAAGPQMKLQWRDQRYATGGPDGPQIDGDASGVDVGVNYKLQPALMVGALAQFDQAGGTLVGAPRSLSDQGWMAGPVTAVQLAPGLSLDARAAWGFAEGGADDLAARAADVQRRLVSARLANTQSFGAWRFTPSINVNHFQEALHGPAAHAAADVSMPQTAGSGRVDIGPELAYRIDLAKAAFVEPRAAIGSFWDFDSLSKLAPGAAAHADMRLKAEAGVVIGITDGAKLQAAGGVEEGDGLNPDVWSGRLQLSVPLK